MGEFLNQLQKLWPLLMQAAWAFTALATSLLALGFFVGRFAFGERIANLKSRLEMRDDRISALSSRLLEQDTAPVTAEALPAPKAPASEPPPPVAPSQRRPAAENDDKKPTSLRELLIGREWYLYFGPGSWAGKKLITFLPDGYIGKGRNDNEYMWAIEGATGDLLTIYRFQGQVQNVFYYSDKYGKFEYMPDSRSYGKKTQSIEPAKL
jgi:hypothetical protein